MGVGRSLGKSPIKETAGNYYKIRKSVAKGRNCHDHAKITIFLRNICIKVI